MRRTTMAFALAAVLAAISAEAAKPQVRVRTEDYFWIDGTTLKIEGRGFDVKDEPYVRIPHRFVGKVPGGITGMGRQSTGLSFRFRTTSRRVVIRWTVRPSGASSARARSDDF